MLPVVLRKLCRWWQCSFQDFFRKFYFGSWKNSCSCVAAPTCHGFSL